MAQDTNQRIEMCCPLNAKICIGGQREDFPKNKAGAPVTCRWWVHLFGADPQTGKVMDQWDCSVAWLPTTTIETAQKTNQVSAEVNEVRKEIKRSTNFTRRIGIAALRGAKQIAEMLEARTVIPRIGNGNGNGGKDEPF